MTQVAARRDVKSTFARRTRSLIKGTTPERADFQIQRGRRSK
jgi:hypothetical protein